MRFNSILAVLLAFYAQVVICWGATPKDPYVLVLIPDQQTNCRSDTLTWHTTMADYIISERAAYDADPRTGRNIRAVSMLGDIAENLDESDPDCGVAAFVRWQDALTSIRMAGIPAIALPGNHDANPTDCGQPGPVLPADCLDTYRLYFGGAYYRGQPWFEKCSGVADNTYFGSDANCSFTIETGNGSDRIAIITTEEHKTSNDAQTAALDWVRAELDRLSHLPAFVLTHINLFAQNPPSTSCMKFGNADYFWDGWKGASNWVALYSAHDVHGQFPNYDPPESDPNLYNWTCRRTDRINPEGFKVLESMWNYQQLGTGVSASSQGTGDGVMVFVTIDEDKGTLKHEACSPPALGNYCRPATSGTGTAAFSESYTESINIKDRRTAAPPAPALSVSGRVALGVALLGVAGFFAAGRVRTRR